MYICVCKYERKREGIFSTFLSFFALLDNDDIIYARMFL